ncbi:MAG: hypothetical protein OEW36_03860, partial [Hylemonella sp.]|nr:hypothetical protein [Hylemonella sp.]
MSLWSLVYEHFDPAQEKQREALCTLGNGYFATRGAGSEAQADEVHYPGTYLAGGYNRLISQVAGREVENEDLVNMPNWLPLAFRPADGQWFDPVQHQILAYRQELDLKQGLLLRSVRYQDSQGRITRLDSRRLVHMAQPHLAAQEITITAENWSGQIEIDSTLDGHIANDGVARYRGLAKRHLQIKEACANGDDGVFLRVRTRQSRIEIALAATTRLWLRELPADSERHLLQDRGRIGHRLILDLGLEAPLRIEKIVSLHCAKDHATSECGLEARESVARAGSFQDLLQSHVLAWSHLWRRFDIGVGLNVPELGPPNLLVLRLHIFHLLQTVSLHTMELDVGVP